MDPSPPAPRSLPRPAILAGFAVSGAAALAYEVVWTRALSVVLGSTTHALSSMLATFMLGLAIGGFTGGRLADRTRRPLAWLGAVEIGIALLGVASLVLIRAMPAAYLSAYRTFHLSAGAFYSAQIALCSLVMLGPTVLMGMTFPLVSRAMVGTLDEVGSGVGKAYGANTIGAVAGSLLAGFVLVPALGLRGTTFAAAAGNLAVGVAFTLAGGGRRGLLLALLALPLGGLAAGGEWSWRLVNFYSAYRYLDGRPYDAIHAADRRMLERLWERDGQDGYVAAFRTRDGHLLVQTGGKLEGTARLDLPNMLLLAHLPVVAHAGEPSSMLVVGLGAGVTLEASKRLVPRVELVEINDGVLEAVSRHGSPGLLDGIEVHRADARNLLLREERRYDVISSAPSYPTEFAVANLFTREYYEIAARRLADGGIYCQWLPYYMLTNDGVTLMLRTFTSVFPRASLWRVPGSLDLIVLGSLSPFSRPPEEVERRVLEAAPALQGEFSLSREPDQLAELSRREDVPINTDDRPLLEFRLARNFRVGDLVVLER